VIASASILSCVSPIFSKSAEKEKGQGKRLRQRG
jgi:hypothetical protein